MFGNQIEDHVADVFTGGVVEIAGGFIGQQYAGSDDHGPGNGYTLTFSTAELMRKVINPVSQANLLQSFAGFLKRVFIFE